MRDKAQKEAAILITCALTFGFAWFDLPGHGASFLARSSAVASAIADGHTLFLLGMIVVTLLMAVFPRRFEQRLTTCLCLSWILGTASLGVFSFADSPSAVAAAVAVTGFSDVLAINIIIGLMLTRIGDRTQQVDSVALALAAKTLLVYVSDRFLPSTAQTVLVVLVPTLCIVCALGAKRIMASEANVNGVQGHIKLSPPLSTLMLGMLFMASIIFATTRVVSPIGFWGTDYPLSGWGIAPVLAITGIYVALCHFTLAKASSELLFRFLPALLILFALYAALYSNVMPDLGMPAGILAVLQQYAELYGQAFVWAVALLAMRKLAMSPVRIMGLLFTTFTVVELLLQQVLLNYGNSSLVVVLLSFFIMFGVLIWALCHFYGRSEAQDKAMARVAASPQDPAPHPDAPHGERADSPDAAGNHALSADARLALAAAHGLSARETDVFLLLAQGRSRRFICEELFIADGTASTYISRVYEKLGVHSKQELLSLVLEHEG